MLAVGGAEGLRGPVLGPEGSAQQVAYVVPLHQATERQQE